MNDTLRIKFVSKAPAKDIQRNWVPLVPSTGFDGIEFTFDPSDDNYDFFVVYEGLAQHENEHRSQRLENLSCAPINTLLITTEPSSIRIDGPQFMRQFGHILTSKSKVLTRHPNHISETPPLRWFYGRPMGAGGRFRTSDELRAEMPIKSDLISTVCSTKEMSHTGHSARLSFVRALRERLAELDVYGRGVRPIIDKAEAMESYRYHIAIENHLERGHWTEKLSDCFLAGCLPFYFGDPDYAKAFPEAAAIPIDIFDLEGAEAIIRTAIAEDEFTKRQNALAEAKERVLNDYNTLAWVAKFVSSNFVSRPKTQHGTILSRYAFRRKHPILGTADFLFRTRMRRHETSCPIQR